MKIVMRLILLLAASLLVAACSPARTGVSGNALTTNLSPGIAIEPQSPLQLVDSGRMWVSPKTNLLPGAATASYDYALFADPSIAPSSAFAYGAIIRLENKDRWEFVPQGKTLPDSFGGREKITDAGREGFLYTLHVPSAGDWASELLIANGKSAPEAWVAKRWLFSLDSATRALAEYREPWPAGLDVPDSDILLLHSEQVEFLRAFGQRARAAFRFSPESRAFAGTPPSATWAASPVHPDVSRLAGDVLAVEHGGDDYE